MRSSNYNEMQNVVVVLAIIFFTTCSDAIQAQQPGRSRQRDIVREIQRVDREQLLLLTPLPPPKNSDASRVALLKKIKEDFRALQNVNNKMMTEVFSTDQIDYGHTSDMISQVRAKAVSLKTNLSLPANNNAKKAPSPNAINGLKDLRAALLILDKSVMSFVNNPMFQKADLVEVNLAMEASRDLEAVISLSGDLKRLTARLDSQSKQTP